MTVPMVCDDSGPVSPELVLVDPALRARLAMRESVLEETVEPRHVEANPTASTYASSSVVTLVPIAAGVGSPESVLEEIGEPSQAEVTEAPAAVVTLVPTTSEDESLVRPDPVSLDAALQADVAKQFPRRSASRRLLISAVAVVALSVAASSGYFVGLRVSGHPTTAADAAALTPPPPPTAPTSTTALAPQAANPADSPPLPASRHTTTPATAQDGVAPSSRTLAWAPVANASAYVVEIIRNGQLIYSSTTSDPRVSVPGEWQRDGRSMTLSSGTYRWYVWPIIGSGATARRSSRAVVASKLAITP
jgi:hypothetical protein